MSRRTHTNPRTGNGLTARLPGPNVLPALMGSPDPYGRQLDGMGSGISSTSKICVLAPSADPAVADVDFTFVQVGVKDGRLDMAGNCGNMMSVVGPVALTRDLYWRRQVDVDPATGLRTVLVRILNTNTSKVVHARFQVEGGDDGTPEFSPNGSYVMDGVSGTASRINLSFINPGGAKTGRTLPTGNPVDTLTLPDGTTIEASLVDLSNPGVFIRVADLGIPHLDTLDPPTVEADGPLKARLEQIRQAGASRMGLDPLTQSVPKIVLIFPPDIAQRSPGGGVDIKCLALSMGQAHKAIPLTLGLCLGAAVRLPGTIPNQLLVAAIGARESVAIGHPGGKLEVGTQMENGHVIAAELYRTARILMKGDVFY